MHFVGYDDIPFISSAPDSLVLSSVWAVLGLLKHPLGRPLLLGIFPAFRGSWEPSGPGISKEELFVPSELRCSGASSPWRQAIWLARRHISICGILSQETDSEVLTAMVASDNNITWCINTNNRVELNNERDNPPCENLIRVRKRAALYTIHLKQHKLNFIFLRKKFQVLYYKKDS